MIYPKFLKTGEKIGVTAPSDGTTNELELNRVKLAISNFESLGFEVKLTPNCLTGEKGRSSSSEVRARELESLFLDSEVDAIICLSGGDFLLEMLSEVDFSIIKDNPKLIQGYSDPTGLLFTITTNLDIATIYNYNFRTFSMKNWHSSLVNNIEVLKGNLLEQNSFDKWNNERVEYIVGDESFSLDSDVKWINAASQEKIEMSGRIIGGCLDLLVNLVGTRFDKVKEFCEKYKSDGIIWYFDNCELSSESVIRAMWQLKEAGWFNHVNGIVFGRSMTEASHYDISFLEAVETSLSSLNVPIIVNADIGHKPPQISIINGALTTITSENGKGKVNFFLS